MKNKEIINGISRDRPCFFAFPDRENENILWLVPVSSKYEKYKIVYDKKVEKYGRCNTIIFGELLGNKAVFLIQNICPVTQKYIREVYVDKNKVPIQVDDRISRDVIENAREVIAKVNRGAVIVFPDIKYIRSELIKQLEIERIPQQPTTLAERLVDAKQRAEQPPQRHDKPNLER